MLSGWLAEELRDSDALGGNGGGAALGFRVLWRGETDTAKQVVELTGSWRVRGSDGLTCGGSAGILLPLGELGLTPVGLNPKPS